MYKILLAEDEQEVLSAMIGLIRWEQHGFETPVGCRDGREAIAKLKEGFVPDAVITDICMPFVDGLELTQYLNEHVPQAIVVVLTGYDDFGYAQKAIQLQVYDYVLKPITPARINELIQRLKQKLDSRQDSGDTMKIVASHFLNRLVTKKMDPVLIEENCRTHRLEFPGRYHLAAVLDVDLPAPSTAQETNTLELMRYGLCNISQELAEQYPNIMVFQGNDGLTNLLASGEASSQVYNTAMALIKLISSTASSSLRISASAGIGEPVAYLDEIWRSREQAVTALGYRFFYGESSIVCSAGIDIHKTQDIDYAAYSKRMEDAVKALDHASAQAAIKDMMEAMRKSHVPYDRCVIYSQKLIMSLLTLVDGMLGRQEAGELEKFWVSSNFYAAPNIGWLEEVVEKVFARAFSGFEVIKTDSAAAQVMKAEAYMKEHYNDPNLSLNTLTEYLAISNSYFSAIFKGKTGSTFIEYLTRLRMERAKQILSMTDRRTYEVAEDVGFSDPHYFSVAFKRVTGMTPKEYREYSHQ